MGGRAAEMQVFGQPSSRAEDDLEHAAALARRMVERLAMTGRFELAGRKDEGGRGNDEGEGGKEVRELLQKAEQAARTILGDNSGDLRTIAETLVLKETLTAAELQEMVRGGGGVVAS
jgi:cell division protease FtsH